MPHRLQGLISSLSTLDLAMFENHRAIKLLIDPESGYIVEANPAACEFYQYNREELTTLRIWDIDTLDEPELRHWIRLAQSAEATEREFKHRLASGEVRDVQIYNGSIKAGGFNFLYWIIIDITERKRAEQQLRQSEEIFTKIFQATPNVVVISRMSDGMLLEVNPGFEAVTGYSRMEAVGHSTLELELWAEVADRERMVADLRLYGQILYQLFPFRRKDGSVRIGQMSVRPLNLNDEACILFVMQDVTESQRVESELRASEERYRLLFERSHDAIFVVDRQSGRYLTANHAAEELTGRTVAQLMQLTVKDIVITEPSQRLLGSEQIPERLSLGEVRYRRPDGSKRTALLNLVSVNDAVMFGIAQDITEIKSAEQRIEHLAYYDVLTGLPNRTLLAQRAEWALTLAGRHSQELAVLFLDVDHFKEVNDALGHIEGDALLAEVAVRLRALVRTTDMVCRVGGDEFVLLLPDTARQGALQVADKVLEAFRKPYKVASHDLNVSVSVGIALYPRDGTDFNELLKNADTALYRVKQQGRNACLSYDREMNAATLQRLVVERDLRQAIGAGELRAYYQPKVRLADRMVIGAEALVRWQHPERGLMLPGQFIPVAEASDLIVQLGNWMLEEVCRQIAEWQARGLVAPTVSVNLAARHFRLPKLADRVDHLLQAHGLPPRLLELEITESTLLEVSAQTTETLQALEQLGVGLALDDFGTGYSSLSYLKRLPLTALKIDRSFVSDLVADHDDRTLAATIVTLGHYMDLVVVAEGVETEEQRLILSEQGCDLAQGYLFGRPVPASEFIDWLAPGTGVGKG